MVYGISGGPIENFRQAWAILPFVGGHGKPHYWRRIQLSNRYQAMCGLTGWALSREEAAERGMPHFRGVLPLEPGVFMVDRCKRCARRHQKTLGFPTDVNNG